MCEEEDGKEGRVDKGTVETDGYEAVVTEEGTITLDYCMNYYNTFTSN